MAFWVAVLFGLQASSTEAKYETISVWGAVLDVCTQCAKKSQASNVRSIATTFLPESGNSIGQK
jgi:ribosome-binding protein aMBF1 (putative translation factor)